MNKFFTKKFPIIFFIFVPIIFLWHPNWLGLLGRVSSTSLFTSSVTLLTSPESKVGVWLDRIQINGLLVG